MSAVSAFVAELVAVIVSFVVLIKVITTMIRAITGVVNALRVLTQAINKWRREIHQQHYRRQQPKGHKKLSEGCTLVTMTRK